mmetsp:Transcript_38978/g.81557  ORF Transcript_38978/g.81557 Transcript_38978/m.81557 type:complete len:322 (+) Transcript_38978:94-1059(+)
MAPHQDEFCDSDVPIMPAVKIIRTKDDRPAAASVSVNVASTSSGNGSASAQEETSSPPTTTMPESILRRAKYTSIDEDNDNTFDSLSHGPQTQTMHRRSVHFPTSTSVVTDVRTRPFTHILDVPALFYSPQDTRRFKREYRKLLRSQIVERERMEWNNREKVDNDSDGSTVLEASRSRQQPQQHDNSFWRSKVGRRWSSSPSSAGATSPDRKSDVVDPLNDDSLVSSRSYRGDVSHESDDEITESTSSSSSPGIFSSVFDVAREAVSILNGPSRHYYSDHQHRTTSAPSRSGESSKVAASPSQVRKPCYTSLHLVDTLYLF